MRRSAGRVRRGSVLRRRDGRYADYVLEERLGSGVSGTVWRARRKGRSGSTVAIKQLKADAGRDDMDRLRGEGEVLSGLDHPHTMKVLEIIDGPDGVAIVMQYAAGGSLEDLLAVRGWLPADQVVAILAPIADAMASAHRRSVFHGDIKPANILFTSDGEPLLSDFGVAAAPGFPPSADDHVRATPEYVDPEVVKGAPPGPRSDIYSLGVVGYEALAGSPPYGGVDPLAVLRAADEGHYEPLREVRADIPVALGVVIERAMQRQPELRPRAAEELAEGLRGSIGHRLPPVLLGHPPAHSEVSERRATHDFGPPPPMGAEPVGSKLASRVGLSKAIGGRPAGLVIGALVGLLAILLLVAVWGITQRDNGSTDDASPPREGRYRYRTNMMGEGPPVGGGETVVEVQTISRSDTNVGQITISSSERTAYLWKPEGLYETETAATQPGTPDVCDWQPDILVLKFPLVAGTQPAMQVSCGEPVGGQVTRQIATSVVGSDRVEIDGKGILVWDIERTETRTFVTGGNPVKVDEVTSTQRFAPKYGLVVQSRLDVRSTTGGKTAQFSIELSLLHVDPL